MAGAYSSAFSSAFDVGAAFPVVVGRNVTDGTTASATPVVNIGSPAAGTLVVVLFRSAAGNPVGWPAGWTEITESTADGSDDATAIAYRFCDGAEGATITLSASNARFAALAYEITGAENPATQAPQISTEATGASTTPDPSSLTPTGGAKDYLWLWLGGWEGEQTSPPASNPTNYTDPTGADSGIVGVVATNVRVAIAERNLNAASEDPGSWTISVTDDWTAWTMAVHPGDAAITGTIGVTQDGNTGALTGVVANPITGVLGTVQDDNQGALTGTVVSDGTLNSIQADQIGTLTGTVANPVSGTVAATQEVQTGSFTGTHTPPAVTGTIGSTQADQTGAFTGMSAFGVAGTIGVTQDDQTGSFTGIATESVTGVLGGFQDDDQFSGSGTVTGVPNVETSTCTLGGPSAVSILGGPSAVSTITEVSVIFV